MKRIVLAATCVLAITATNAGAGGFFGNWAKSAENQSNPLTGAVALVVYPAKVAMMATVGNAMSYATTGRHIEGTMAPIGR